MAAIITARLCSYVKGAIDCPITRIVCWTDNSSTLHWIRRAASQWEPFFANRVIEIQSLLDPSVCNYCPGPQNPGDLPTRGFSTSQLKEESHRRALVRCCVLPICLQHLHYQNYLSHFQGNEGIFYEIGVKLKCTTTTKLAERNSLSSRLLAMTFLKKLIVARCSTLPPFFL